MTTEPSEEQVDPRTVTRPVKLPQAGLERNTGEPFIDFTQQNCTKPNPAKALPITAPHGHKTKTQ